MAASCISSSIPAPGRCAAPTAIDILDGHFAIRVADFERAVAHLRAHGVECVELPHNVTPWKQVYFTDPDGNEIELNVDR